MTIKSVKAIITKKKKYLLQLRDNKKNIFFPNYWGLFGGRLNIDEKNSIGILREIKEELNLEVKIRKEIMRIDYDMISFKKKRKLTYYECFTKDFSKLILFEGKRFEFLAFNELKCLKIIPMDLVAINAHYNYIYKAKVNSR